MQVQHHRQYVQIAVGIYTQATCGKECIISGINYKKYTHSRHSVYRMYLHRWCVHTVIFASNLGSSECNDCCFWVRLHLHCTHLISK